MEVSSPWTSCLSQNKRLLPHFLPKEWKKWDRNSPTAQDQKPLILRLPLYISASQLCLGILASNHLTKHSCQLPPLSAFMSTCGCSSLEHPSAQQACLHRYSQSSCPPRAPLNITAGSQPVRCWQQGREHHWLGLHLTKPGSSLLRYLRDSCVHQRASRWSRRLPISPGNDPWFPGRKKQGRTFLCWAPAQ